MFDFAEGQRTAYDEQKRLVRLGDGPGLSNILRLNHYFTRSQGEFAAKVARKVVKHGHKVSKIGEMRRIAGMLEEAAFYDDTILRFVPEVKQRLRARMPAPAPFVGSRQSAGSGHGSTQPDERK